MMQNLKSQMPSIRNAKHKHCIYTVGVFAVICVVANLLISFLSQLLEADQENTILFVVLSVAAFFAGSKQAGRKKTEAGNAKVVPAKKQIKTRSMAHEGEREGRQAAQRLVQARGPTPVASPELSREAALPAHKLIQAWGTTPVAPPEVEREAARSAQTAEPQPEVSEKPLKAPRFAAKRSVHASGTTPVAPPEGEREAGQAARTAEPQPESPEKPVKAHRYALRSCAGAKVSTEMTENTGKQLAWKKTRQSEIDEHVIEQARREGVEPSASVYSALMHACVRLNDADMALKLLDQILDKHMNCDYNPTVHTETDARNSFFTYVAGQLNDGRLRKDGLQILGAVGDHGIQPPLILQDRLVCAWDCKVPDQVLNYFKKMRQEGLALSSAACLCIKADRGGYQNDPSCDAEEKATAVEEPDVLHTATAERVPFPASTNTLPKILPKSTEG